MTIEQGSAPSTVVLGVTTLYGAQTRRGLVELRLGAERVQLELDTAREVARWLFEAAASAEQDEVLVEWLAGPDFGLELAQVGQVLMSLRERREQKGYPGARAQGVSSDAERKEVPDGEG